MLVPEMGTPEEGKVSRNKLEKDQEFTLRHTVFDALLNNLKWDFKQIAMWVWESDRIQSGQEHAMKQHPKEQVIVYCISHYNCLIKNDRQHTSQGILEALGHICEVGVISFYK